MTVVNELHNTRSGGRLFQTHTVLGIKYTCTRTRQRGGRQGEDPSADHYNACSISFPPPLPQS